MSALNNIQSIPNIVASHPTVTAAYSLGYTLQYRLRLALP
jgi:hypothetical protein